MKSLVAFVVITLVALAVSLAVYLGAFKEIAISDGEVGPYRFVYKSHVGAYHKIVPVIEEIERWAVVNGESCQTSFGEYIDDPNVTDEDRLHSNGGCVVVKDWAGQRLPDGFLQRQQPKRLYVIVDFDGAPSIGPMKVYPKANRYIADKGLRMDGSVIETYERVGARGLRTRYLFPVQKIQTQR